MIDLGLLAKLHIAILAKPRRFVTAATLGAVVLQESGGMPYFIDSKPGSEMYSNISDAINHAIYHYTATGEKLTTEYVATGLTYKTILAAITIPPAVGNFMVPSAMRGRPAKFRFEYSYWKRFKTEIENPADRFIYSSSWGLCQFMGPNIAKEPTPEGLEFIKRFAADVDMQLLYAAAMIDDLLASNKGNVDAMYREYNSGSAESTAPKVVARAQQVAISAQKIQQFIDSRTAKI